MCAKNVDETMNSLDRELVELHRKEKQLLSCVQPSNDAGIIDRIPIGEGNRQ
jgi:hypothetical protein